MSIAFFERAQFSAADGVYSISPSYMSRWQAIIQRNIHYIDPSQFTLAQPPAGAWSPAKRSKPSIYCIGRSERRKGNDLFIEIVRWLNPASFETAAHVGDQDRSSSVSGSALLLGKIAEARGISVEHRRALDRVRTSEAFCHTINSRYSDTLRFAQLSCARRAVFGLPGRCIFKRWCLRLPRSNTPEFALYQNEFG